MGRKITYKTKTWVYLSLLMLAVIAGVNLFLYSSMKRQLIASARRQTFDTLIQMRDTNDMFLDNAEQSLKALTSNEDLEFFAVRFSHILDYREKEIVYDQVSGILNLSPYFTSCYVYYPEQTGLIDVNTYTPSYKLLSESSSQLMILRAYEIYQENGKDGLYPVRNADGEVEWILMVAVRCSNHLADSVPVLMVTVDNSYFFQGLGPAIRFEDSKVYLSDGYGNWLNYDQPDRPADIGIVPEENGSEVTEVDGRSCLVTYAISERFGWCYWYLVPTSVIYRQLRSWRLLLALTAILSGALVLVLLRLLMQSLYRPIEKISRQLGDAGSADREGMDAVNVLQEGVPELISRNRSLRKQLDESKEIARNEFLRELLENSLDPGSPVQERAKAFGIPCADMRYRVIMLSGGFDAPSGMPVHPGWAQGGELQRRQSLERAAREAFDAHSPDVLGVIGVENGSVAVLLGRRKEAGEDASFAPHLEQIRQEIECRLGWPVELGSSTVAEDLTSVPMLYGQAGAALSYRFILGSSRVIRFENVPSGIPEPYGYPWDIEKEIAARLRQGDAVESCRHVEIFAEYIHAHVLRPEACRQALLHLYTDLTRLLEDMGLDCDIDAGKCAEFRQKLYSCSFSAGMVDVLKEFCGCFCLALERRRDVKNRDLAQQAVAFLDEHYAKPTLDLEYLAREMGCSVSYLSKIFKLATGNSIKEYITMKRITKSCELLETTDMKIWEIGEQTGYTQQRSFIEIFKKYKGMTPSEYRRRERKVI